ncbi:MAG: ABC transporter permease [Chloroflexi bacterium]|nr:ABC transporter permease [Chloroflexota bacterium]MCL5076086.1 ABC transporter permease [Chloroflexota bacterium]
MTGQHPLVMQPSISQTMQRWQGLLDGWRRFSKGKLAVFGLCVAVLTVLLAMSAPLLTGYDPLAISRERLLSPTLVHPMGTDNVGKDVFSGVLYGSRVSLTVGLLAAFTSFSVGLLIGSLAGYYGGSLDSLLMRISEFFQIMPRFFLALLVVAMLGGGLEKTIAVIGLLSWPATARIVRAQFLALKEREFVESARAIGFGDRHIIISEILPNALPPAIVQGTLDIALAILLEANLSFFGLGDPRMPSWGEMLNRAQPFLRSAWWMSVFPGTAIFINVLAFNLVGDGLNDLLNPELKER